MTLVKKKVRFQAPVESGWKYLGSPNFEDVYTVVIDKAYDASNHNTRPIFTPYKSEGPKQCAICGKFEGQVAFKNEAHIIPACLGNSIYLSHEECDDCNDRLNKEVDSHFGEMTKPVRGLYRMPTREGTAKWTNEGVPSENSFDPLSGLVITTGGQDSILKVALDEKGKKIHIEGPGHSYKPARAIGALLHICWLFFNKIQRQKYPYILDLLENKLKISPFIYFIGSEPWRQPHYIHYVVYEKNDEKNELPSLVIWLSFGPYFLVWASPVLDKRRYITFPFPAVDMIDGAPLPSLSMYSLDDPDKTIKADKIKFTFLFDKIEPSTIMSSFRV